MRRMRWWWLIPPADGPSLLDELAPGAEIAGHLIYDLPVRSTITTLTLRTEPTPTTVEVPPA